MSGGGTVASKEEDKPALARHAQVVPAFVAVDIRRPLESWVGTIQPVELLRWQRKGDLTESARRELRNNIVKRTRVRAERLWSKPVGVSLADGWRERLTSIDRKRIEQLPLTAERPLETWTLREVKEALRVPLEQTLGLLAKLEAVYWEPPLASQVRASAEHLECGPPVQVTSELQDLATTVLQLPWVGKVSPRDLRFGFPGDASLADWIRGQVAQPTVPGSFPGLLERLLAADKFTAEEEARDLAVHAARDCTPRAGGEESAQRWVAMLMRRHISPSGAGRKLVEVGDEFGVTRERIRQICEAFEDLFAEAETSTPALDRALQAAARVAPFEVDELDEQLRRFIGAGAGIESLLAWAGVLGHEKLPVQCERVRTRVRGKLVELTMVQAPDAPPWVEPMIRHISRDSSMFGCTNVLRIAGRLALKEGVAPGQEAIEMALEAAAGFRWLDKETGWFVLGDGSNCSAASRVRKIMAVAHDTVGTDEIVAALASDDMWMYRESTSIGLATPPVHVLRELFLGWPWLKVVQKSRFVAGDGCDTAGALTDAEQACVSVIAAHHGVACRFELKEVVLGQLGLTEVMLAALLGSSPVFDRLEHGLYCVIGRRVGDTAVNAARQRLRERNSPQTATSPDLGPDEFLARVTEASLKNEQYHVPARFHSLLAGKRHSAFTTEGGSTVEARVSQSGALAGVNRLFPHVRPGDHYCIAVLPDGLRVRHTSVPLMALVQGEPALDAASDAVT